MSRRGLDKVSHVGTDDVTIDMEANVDDNRHLYKAIMENSMKMIGSISQQMVEFDNERKAADAEGGSKLHAAVEEMHAAVLDSTSDIKGSVSILEKEVHEGQRHTELIQLLEAVHQHAQMGSNFDPILGAIGEIATTDLGGVFEQFGTMHETHAALHNSHLNVMEQFGAMHDRHSNVQGILESLRDNHQALHAKHHDLLGAVSNVEVDMDPFHAHFGTVNEWMRDHGGKVRTMDGRLQALEQGVQETKSMLGTILAAIQELGSPGGQLLQLQREVQGHRGHVAELLKSHSEQLLGRLDSHGEALRSNHSSMLDAFSDHSTGIGNKVSSMPDHSKLLYSLDESLRGHIGNLASSHGAMLDNFGDHTQQVHEKIDTHSQRLLEAMSALPDHDSLLNTVDRAVQGYLDDVKESHGELAGMLARVPTEHDHSRTADVVHQRMEESLARVGDHSHILSAIHGLGLGEREERLLEAFDAMGERMLETMREVVGNISMNIRVESKDIDSTSRFPTSRVASPGSASARGPARSPSTTVQNGAVASTSSGFTVRPLTERSPRSTGEAACSASGAAARPGSHYEQSPTRKTMPDAGSGGYSPAPARMATPRALRLQREAAAEGRSEPSPARSQRNLERFERIYRGDRVEADPSGYSCKCGFTCGTEGALQRHFERFRGESGHSRACS